MYKFGGIVMNINLTDLISNIQSKNDFVALK